MERKIGEIVEYNGEWYQCVVAMQGCRECLFRTQDYCTRHSGCMSTERSDKTSVIFKKLEKVGEPYVGNNGTFQSYKLAMPIYGDIPDQITGFTTTEVVIKQNKEDMEEKKTNFVEEIEALCKRYNMSDGVRADFISEIKEIIKDKDKKHSLKPFDLEAAKLGKPVCTRNGRKARIVCFDAKGDKPIIALVEAKGNKDALIEKVERYFINGHSVFEVRETNNDLMMLPEKKEGWIIVSKNATIYDSLEDAKKIL